MTRRRLPPMLALACLLLSAATAPAARVVAVGDVHGEIDGFDSVLRAASLIDDNGDWIGGDAVLVQTGDMTDRGPRVRAVMDRLRALQEQAPAQGGRVVVLLGNHEVSNLIHIFDYESTPARVYAEIWADFTDKRSQKRQRSAYKVWFRWLHSYPGCVKQEHRDWREDRQAWLDDHPPGFVEYLEALSAEGDYGAWLRGLSIVEEIDGDLFLHGGLSPELVEQGYSSVTELNQRAREAFERLDAARRQLTDEGLIVPFSTLWELHCALFVELARLEEGGGAKDMRRRAELEALRAGLPGMPGWFLTEANGPLWYRGLANAEEAELGPRLDGILEAFGARRIAVGHTPQNGAIRSRFDDRVFLIDTAMAYPELGGRAAALEIDGDRVTAIYADERVTLVDGGGASLVEPPVEGSNGEDHAPVDSSNGNEQQPLESSNGNDHEAVESSNGNDDEALEDATEPQEGQEVATGEAPGDAAAKLPKAPAWTGPDGQPLPFASLSELLVFLANAKVVRSESVDTGVTLPRKMLLEHNGVRAHGIFHDIEVEKRRERLRGGKVVSFFRDHYANNVAAFELSRMLGMTNVPPAVVRRVGRDKGSMQLWIEGARTEGERRQSGLAPPGDWRLTAKDMLVFDNLINNIDRNQGNILFDADWNMLFIDHTRSFGRLKQLPAPDRVRRCSRRLYQALRELDEEEVITRLRPYLGIYEIRGLLERRDTLVALIDERIATNGEMAVLFDYGDPQAASTADEPDVPEAPPGP